MSITKRLMEEDVQKHQRALDILLKAGVLQRCDIHEHIVYQAYSAEVSAAVALGNNSWVDYSDVFSSKDEMDEWIEKVAEDIDYANDKCETCRAQMVE